MADANLLNELTQLREQLAALTRRVYQLEVAAAGEKIPLVTPPAQPIAPIVAPPPMEPPQVSAVVPPRVFEAPPSQPAIPAPVFAHVSSQAQKPPQAAHVSLESRIGGQLLNRVGIVAVLVGLSYFLKLAFDNHWIGPTMEVIIGLLAGIGLLIWSERFRAKGYATFGYSLKAVAIGALYLSLWAASQYYHLVPPAVSFFGMVTVTVLFAALSLRQNSELLAAYALVGGFLTPVLVSTGQNHPIGLFSYMALLDAGTVWVASIKNWRRLVYGSLVPTAMLFVAWVSSYYSPEQLVIALVFLAFVFLLYTALAARQESELLAGIVLVGSLLAVGVIFPTQVQELQLLLFLTLLDVACFYLAMKKSWRRLLGGSLLGTIALCQAWSQQSYTPAALGLTLAFATFFFLLYVAAPFLGSAPREQHRRELVGIVVVNAVAYFTACYLMLQRDHRTPLVVLTLGLAALYFVLARFVRPYELSATPLFAPLHIAIAIGFITAAIPLKFNDRWIEFGWLVEAGALFWASHRSKSMLLRHLGIVAFALGAARLTLLDSEARQPLIFNPRFGLYLVAIAALALLAYYAIKEGGALNIQQAAGAVIALNVFALIALHCEVMDYFAPVAGQTLSDGQWRSLNIARDFTYSAVWMVYGSGLMLVGFWKRSAFLRWQGIVLLSATAAKVFFYDISALERGYRILAFIVLGAVLLAVSFFYQRSRARVAE